jgi:hypothetical protein
MGKKKGKDEEKGRMCWKVNRKRKGMGKWKKQGREKGNVEEEKEGESEKGGRGGRGE